MQFSYRALDSSGFIQKGTLEVDSEAAALAILQEREYAPLELKALHTATGQPTFSASQTIKHGDIVALIRELATLLASGVGLSESFTTLLEATSHRGMKEALAQLNQSVRSGEGFSAALHKSPLKLPQYVYALSRAGEETGDLGSALARCAEQLRRYAERIEQEATAPGEQLTADLTNPFGPALAAALAALPDWGPTPIATEQQAKTS